MEAERREGPRRLTHERRADNGDDVGDDSLMALIASLQDAMRRDREVYDREIDELKTRQRHTDERLSRLTGRVLISAGGFAAVVYFASWIGPTVFREAIKALIGP